MGDIPAEDRQKWIENMIGHSKNVKAAIYRFKDEARMGCKTDEKIFMMYKCLDGASFGYCKVLDMLETMWSFNSSVKGYEERINNNGPSRSDSGRTSETEKA